MAPIRPNRTTIVIAPEVRDGLKHIARKDQTYNELLADLIKLHTDYIEKRFGGGQTMTPPQNHQQATSDQSHQSLTTLEDGHDNDYD